MWFITVTNATVTVIVFLHGNVPTVITAVIPRYFYRGKITEGSPAKFDFTVDEGKEWLSPSREKN